VDEPTEETNRVDEPFSWEQWFAQGLKALRRALFRYDFGLPEEFWQHMEQAFREALAAGRILMRALLDRRRQPPPPPEESRGEIEIDWE